MSGHVSIGRILRDLPALPETQPQNYRRISRTWRGEAQGVRSREGRIMRDFLIIMSETVAFATALGTILLIFIALGA